MKTDRRAFFGQAAGILALPALTVVSLPTARPPVRSAIARYHRTRRRLDVCESWPADPELDRLSDQIVNEALDAEQDLIEAILGTAPGNRGVKFAHRPRGVIANGTLYLAIQDPDDETPLGQTARHGCNLMRLVIVPLSSIADLNAKGGAL